MGCTIAGRVARRFFEIICAESRNPASFHLPETASSTVRRIEAVDFGPLATRTGDNEANHFVAFFDHFHVRATQCAFDRTFRPLRLMTVGCAQWCFGIRFSTEEKRFHGVCGVLAKGADLGPAPVRRLRSRAFAVKTRLSVRRWCASEFGGSPGKGRVSA